MTTKSDTDLLHAWRDGDKRAGFELFERYYPRLWRFFNTKAPADSEDLVQETMLQCLRSHQRLKDAGSFRGFLYAIARHQLSQRLRIDHRDDNVARKVGAAGPTSRLSPSLMLAGRNDAERLMMSLRRLPLELQLTLELYYWERLSYDELAYVLGIGREAVKSRLRRARQALRELMEQCESDPKAWPFENWERAMEAALSTTRMQRLRRDPVAD
jgi:RNA polymerase sigma-70 factor (ECF subfamily)